MTEHFTVRQAVPGDIEVFLPLYDAYMVFYRQSSNPDKYRGYLQQRLSREEATVFLSENAESECLGFALNYRSYSSVSQGKVVILNDLFVLPEVRGHGIGRKLIKRVFQFAKEDGAVRVDIGTEVTNKGAQKLYEGIGFKRDVDFFQYNYYI